MEPNKRVELTTSASIIVKKITYLIINNNTKVRNMLQLDKQNNIIMDEALSEKGGIKNRMLEQENDNISIAFKKHQI